MFDITKFSKLKFSKVSDSLFEWIPRQNISAYYPTRSKDYLLRHRLALLECDNKKQQARHKERDSEIMYYLLFFVLIIKSYCNNTLLLQIGGYSTTTQYDI